MNDFLAAQYPFQLCRLPAVLPDADLGLIYRSFCPISIGLFGLHLPERLYFSRKVVLTYFLLQPKMTLS